MGSEKEARARYEEKFVPRHRVRLTRGFWLQETEVTQSQYFAIAGAKPSFWRSKRTHDHPVERVSWEDVFRTRFHTAFGDDLIAVDRLRLATEGAVRENIRQAIQELERRDL